MPRDATASSAAWRASPKSATPGGRPATPDYLVRVATADRACDPALYNGELASVPR